MSRCDLRLPHNSHLWVQPLRAFTNCVVQWVQSGFKLAWRDYRPLFQRSPRLKVLNRDNAPDYSTLFPYSSISLNRTLIPSNARSSKIEYAVAVMLRLPAI